MGAWVGGDRRGGRPVGVHKLLLGCHQGVPSGSTLCECIAGSNPTSSVVIIPRCSQEERDDFEKHDLATGIRCAACHQHRCQASVLPVPPLALLLVCTLVALAGGSKAAQGRYRQVWTAAG